MRNIQLSFLSLPFGLFTCLIYDWSTINSQGFFFGYDLFIWYLVVLQATGGLLVAMVVKYAGIQTRGPKGSYIIYHLPNHCLSLIQISFR